MLRDQSTRQRLIFGRSRRILLVIGLVLLGQILGDRAAKENLRSALPESDFKTGYGPSTFDAATKQIDVKISASRAFLSTGPKDWLQEEALARALIARWRLSGDFADLAEADRLITHGLAKAPYPSGPVLSKAVLSVLVHKTDAASQALARAKLAVIPDPADSAEVAALMGDVALQKGQLRTAEMHYRTAQKIAPSLGNALRLSNCLAMKGDRQGARQLLESLIARQQQQPMVLAQLMLQRANLAYWEGDWPLAGRWVKAAQKTFPGYWLAEAYAAQQLAITGHTPEAIAAYKRIIEKSGRPEVMDALAHLLRLSGYPAESRAWAALAKKAWLKRAALFPEATAHHQAEHELAVGNAATALQFAAADAKNRPSAPNLVLYARALLSLGRANQALAALNRADSQGWVSANQALVRSEVLAALGNSADSQAAMERALSLNPNISTREASLIWFGHD